MTRRTLLPIAALAAGLVAVLAMGLGTVGSHPLALAMIGLIVVAYVAGAMELRRFDADTLALRTAVDALDAAAPASLADWVRTLPASLQPAVRGRVEGERLPLPGPAMTPYLAGLLVLLGMLGTFVGMVLTLRGTGTALEGAADLQALRATLVTPVKGLGLAFATSVAGVAASAMLGLASSWCRRERQRAGRALDAAIGGPLRPFSAVQQRETSLAVMQRQAALLELQAGLLPAVVERLQQMAQAMERQQADAAARLLESQQRFQQEAARAYVDLAASVARTLDASVVQGAQAAGEATRAVVADTMAGVARETLALHEATRASVQDQVGQLGRRLEDTTTRVAALWDDAIARQAAQALSLAAELRDAAQSQGAAADARQAAQSAAMNEQLAAQVEGLAGRLVREHEAMLARLAEQAGRREALAAEQQEAGDRRATVLHETLSRQALALQDALEQRAGQLLDALTASTSAWRESAQGAAQALAQQAESLPQRALDAVAPLMAGLVARLDETARRLDEAAQAATGQQREAATSALAQQQAVAQAVMDQQRAAAQAAIELQREAARSAIEQQREDAQAAMTLQREAAAQLAERMQSALEQSRSAFESQAAALVAAIAQARDAHEAAAAARDAQREQAWTGALSTMAASLQGAWREAGDASLAQQREVCTTLEHTARDITTRAEAHAQATIAEIARLVNAASEAPRAAAEVMAELRQKLADSLAHDNAVLDERQRLLATLETLLDGVNRGAGEQRAAIDALVGNAGALMDRLGERFEVQVAAESARLEQAAAQVTAGVAEVASLGEGFGVAVTQFGDASGTLVGQLERIESALGRSLARSDEQLAYYVAQAREVVDLSLLSQRQILESLQARAAAEGALE